MADREIIPVIDLGPYLAGDLGAIDRTAAELRFALTEIGFYFIVNHGVPSGQIREVFRQVARFLFQHGFGFSCAANLALTKPGKRKCERRSSYSKNHESSKHIKSPSEDCISSCPDGTNYRNAADVIAQIAAQSQRDDANATISKSPLVSRAAARWSEGLDRDGFC